MKATRAEPEIKKQKVVVLGTGWVGTRFLKQGKDVLYEVVLISPQSNSAFNAPSVTTVEPHSNIVNKENVDECFTIDSQSKKVVQYCRGHGKQEEFEEEYDYLVIAMGLNTTTDLGVVEHCNFLKEVEDARKIHRFFVDAFEKYKAILPSLTDEEITTGLWHFVVVDGGKEFAAELHNFVNEDLVKDAREYVKITSLEAAGRIETMFDKRITEFTEAGVTVDWSAETGFDSAIRDFMKNVRQEDIAIFNKEEGDNF
ncbi:External alternative NAD(P)H-ubiquinone oxidoreductase B2, mitochondrial, partial [Linum grandiflorum]